MRRWWMVCGLAGWLGGAWGGMVFAAPLPLLAPTGGPAPAAQTTPLSDMVAYTVNKSPEGETGAPLVQVTLQDGTPATFLLDTGTSVCAVTDAMASRLKLTPAATDRPATPLIMDGPKARSVSLTIQLGRFRFANFPTVIVKADRFRQVLGRDMDGILGSNLLGRFALILEPQSHVLMLQSPGGLSDDAVRALGFLHPGVLPLSRADNGTFWVPVSLGNGILSVQENLMIDTGGGMTIVSHRSVEALGLTPDRTKLAIPYGGGTVLGDIARVPSLILGDTKAKADPSALAASPLEAKDTAVIYPSGADPFGGPHALGMNVLSKCDLLLDFPGGHLYVQPSR